MKKVAALLMILVVVMTVASLMSVSVFADEPATDTAAQTTDTAEAAEAADDGALSAKAIAAAVVVGIVGTAGAIGMAMAISKSTESMARQPEAASKINSAMMLGLVFIETAIIYALIIAILIIFVL